MQGFLTPVYGVIFIQPWERDLDFQYEAIYSLGFLGYFENGMLCDYQYHTTETQYFLSVISYNTVYN